MENNKSTATFAVMSVFFLTMSLTTITPALQNISLKFPDIPFTSILLIATLPSLTAIPCNIISGAISGSKVKFRTILLFAISLFVLAGTAPYFFGNFTSILISRVVFGIALGTLMPLGSSITMKLFEGQKRANVLGMGQVFMNIGAISLQMLAGFLCSINVDYTWFAHLLAILSLLIVLIFLPEPEKTEQISGEKTKLPVSVFIICIANMILFVFLIPFTLNMSTIVINGNLGNAATAATVLSLYTVGGMVGGVLFGSFFKIFGKLVIPFAAIVCAIGLGIVFYADSLSILIIGSIIAGLGYSLSMPGVFMELGMIVSPSGFTLSSGILMGLLNFGGFISSFYLVFLAQIFVNPDPKFPIFVGAIGYVVVAIIWGIVKLRQQHVKPPAINA